MISYGQNNISAAYVGSTPLTVAYLGPDVVWSVLTPFTFWYNIASTGCVALRINSSANVNSGINWEGGVYSGILLGVNNYNYCY
jgi:hypothetical protein